MAGCALASLGAVAPLAAAAGDGPVSAEVRRVAGQEASRTDSGLYRVRPETGPALLTHGPDSAPPPRELESPLERELPKGVGFEPGSAERPPACAATEAQRILYAHPNGSADALASVRPRIQAAIRRMNAVLNEESLQSGGPSADYRVRCTGAGEISVDGFSSSGTSFSEIVTSARDAGFDSQLVDYTIFFDGSAGGSCGIASYADDETLSADNLANQGGGYAVIYSACWYGETPMHESGHNMGAVQYGAPNSTGDGGHCYEEDDVMCYSPDGGNLHQDGPINNCPGTARFDCNFDDYFDSAPEPGEYLETHWNLGSPLNAFIAFGGAAPAEPAEARARWRMRDIHVSRHTRRLEISLRDKDGVTLYLSRGHRPSKSRFACRAYAKNGRAQCRIKEPQRGHWIAGVERPIGAGTSSPLRVKKQLEARRKR